VRRDLERWIADVRVGAIVFAVLEVGVFTEDYPPGYQRWAWLLTAAFAAGAIAFAFLVRRPPGRLTLYAALASVVFDTAIIGAFALLYSYEYGSPTRWALVFPAVEAALRFGLAGGVVLPLVLGPAFAFLEWWRADRFGPPGYISDRVTFPTGVVLLVGVIVGWLAGRLGEETPRRRRCATSSAAASTCSTPRRGARGRSAPRSTSTRPSTRSCASCAASSASTAWRSCSPRRGVRA
jgi:hypothetical protein